MLIKDSGKKLAQEAVPYYLAILSASTDLTVKDSRRFWVARMFPSPNQKSFMNSLAA